MVQGKFKKTKLPANLQKKQKQKSKVAAFTRRANAPIQPKKAKFTENQKIKQVISKSVNKSAENELRSRAVTGQLNLSKAQQAVAKHNKTVVAESSTAGASTSAAASAMETAT